MRITILISLLFVGVCTYGQKYRDFHNHFLEGYLIENKNVPTILIEELESQIEQNLFHNFEDLNYTSALTRQKLKNNDFEEAISKCLEANPVHPLREIAMFELSKYYLKI